jgi:high-affinity iron transporter
MASKIARGHYRSYLRWNNKTPNYVLFLLPFITVLREGLEAVIFVAGVALGSDPSTIPGAVILGVLSGIVVGLTIWIWGTHSSTRYSIVGQLF